MVLKNYLNIAVIKKLDLLYNRDIWKTLKKKKI